MKIYGGCCEETWAEGAFVLSESVGVLKLRALFLGMTDEIAYADAGAAITRHFRGIGGFRGAPRPVLPVIPPYQQRRV